MTEHVLKYGVISIGLVALILSLSVLVIVAQRPSTMSLYTGSAVVEPGSTNTQMTQSVTVNEPDVTRATVTVSR